MKKNIKFLSILVLLFASFTLSVAQTVVKLSKAERILNDLDKPLDISPSEIYANPYLLNNTWLDEAVPTDMYPKDAVEWQKKLNAKQETFVAAYSPIEDEELYKVDNYSLPIEQRNIDNEPITPYTWKWVDFERNEADGTKTIANLKRPNWWIKHLGATKVGNKVYLNISEQGISGEFVVTKIRPCQIDTRFEEWKRKGDYVGRPITGRFVHNSNNIWEFEFDNGEVIGCTPTHPFFSEKRQAYIPVGQLEIGEPIRNKEGKTIAIKSKKQKEGSEIVYNLEIYRDHNFLVGYSGLLVHNACYTKVIEKYIDETATYFKEIVEDATQIFYKRLNQVSEMSIEQINFIKNLKNKIPAVESSNFSIAKVEFPEGVSLNNEYYTCFSGSKTIDDLPTIIKSENPGYASKNIKQAGNISNGKYETFGCDYKGNLNSSKPRHLDTEVKILEDFRKDLLFKYPNARSESFKFKITINSELFPCKSCTKVIGQFLEEFKGASIDIVTRTSGFIN